MSMQFLKTDPELSGLSLMNSIGAFTNGTLARLRAQYGLSHIVSREWYPAYTVMAMLRDLSHTEDGPFTLVSMGITYSTRISLPNYVRDIPGGLLQLCEVLYQSWRSGSPGDYSVEVRSPTRVRISVTNSKFPMDYVYGMIYGMANRTGPNQLELKINREVHGAAMIFDLSWEIMTAPLKL